MIRIPLEAPSEETIPFDTLVARHPTILGKWVPLRMELRIYKTHEEHLKKVGSLAAKSSTRFLQAIKSTD